MLGAEKCFVDIIDINAKLEIFNKRKNHLHEAMREKEDSLQRIDDNISSVDDMISEAKFELSKLEGKHLLKKSDLEKKKRLCEKNASKINQMHKK
eukprot:4038128-Ditylum_brightwellii.AAC.1